VKGGVADTDSNLAAIGLFDSGVGGLTVLREVMRLLPGRDTLYLADNAHCPYGARTPAQVQALSEEISRYLLGRGAGVVVLACNTASAAALYHLRERFPATPFVGMVPAVKPAAAETRSGVVGVLATPTTLGGALFSDVVEHHAGGVRVLTQECPGLVERVEAGDLAGPATRTLLQRYVGPLLEAGADTLVLGCTHYPFLKETIEGMAGPNVRVLDPSAAVARQVQRVAGAGAAMREGRHILISTGDPAPLQRAARQFLGLDVEVEVVTWHHGRLG